MTASCAAGTSWDGAQCAPIAPSATISASNCTIASGQATCDTSITWDIQNAATPNVAVDGTQQFTDPQGTNVSHAVGYGTHTMDARDGATVLNSATMTASCAAGTSWAGAQCAVQLTPQ